MAVRQIIENARAAGDISDAEAILVAKMYDDLLTAHGDHKKARSELIAHLEREAAVRRHRAMHQKVPAPNASGGGKYWVRNVASAFLRGWVTCIASFALGVVYYNLPASPPTRSDLLNSAGAPAIVAGLFWFQGMIGAAWHHSDGGLDLAKLASILAIEKLAVAYVSFGLGFVVAILGFIAS